MDKKKIILIGGGGHCKACTDEQIPDFKDKTDEFLISVGQIGLPKRRKAICNLFIDNSSKLATVISSLAYVSKHSSISEGSIIMHGEIVNANAKVGNNCIINTKALIEHEAIVENHCHVATAAIINGGVCLGADSFFGSNSVSKQHVSIAKESFIKANTVVK